MEAGESSQSRRNNRTTSERQRDWAIRIGASWAGKCISKGPFIAITRALRRNGASWAEELIKVKILPDTNKYFQVGASMKDEDRVQVLLFLTQKIDVFTWSPYEVPEIDPEFIVHKLNVDPSYPPKK